MRALLTLSIVILSTPLLAAPNRSEIKTALQRVVQQNWVVAESANFLLISNRNEVTFYNAMQMGKNLERDRQERLARGKRGNFVIKITIGPFLSQDLYDGIRSSLPRRRLDVAYEIPFQDYYSVRWDALPEGYGPGYSVYISTDRHPYLSVWPESSNQECQRVLESVQQIFERYREPDVVQPDGAANRGQPVGSETNRTSTPAGPGG